MMSMVEAFVGGEQLPAESMICVTCLVDMLELMGFFLCDCTAYVRPRSPALDEHFYGGREVY